jgi:hypothetical protein
MTNLKNKIEKLEIATKPELQTVRELVEFVLSVQRGQASIHSATIGADLLGLDTAKACNWQKRAEDIAAKYDKSVEEVKRDLIAQRPELGAYL